MDLDEESIPAPPDCTCTSYEEAYNVLKNHGLKNGYGFRLRRSWLHHSNIKTRFSVIIAIDPEITHHKQGRGRQYSLWIPETIQYSTVGRSVDRSVGWCHLP
jgi:hypothetical protein